MNLKLSGIAAAAGFVLSLLVGVLSGGAFGVSLLRAVSFGIVFFILGNVIWVFINRFLPELLLPREEDEPLMSGLETGSRVDISVGDDDLPINAAIPPEDDSKRELGNVAELIAKGARVQSGGQGPAPAPNLNQSGGQTPAEVPALDLGAEAGYSNSGVSVAPGGGKQNGAPAASGPAAPAAEPAAVFVPSPPPSPLQAFSGGDIEALPDLDAMAGAFMSSEEEEGEQVAAPVFGAEPKPRASGKAKGREDDYNPKEVASAIQTLLKRD